MRSTVRGRSDGSKMGVKDDIHCQYSRVWATTCSCILLEDVSVRRWRTLVLARSLVDSIPVTGLDGLFYYKVLFLEYVSTRVCDVNKYNLDRMRVVFGNLSISI